MTGPAGGKLGLNAGVYLRSEEGKVKLEDALVYIHVKGHARARVTHLDIEHDILDNIIPPKRGRFLTIHGVEGGIRIDLGKPKEVNLNDERIEVERITVLHPHLSKVLEPNQKTRTWVGGKFGGIYIGFRKGEIAKLERIAETKFEVKPRKKLEEPPPWITIDER